MDLESKAPNGPIETRWDRHRFNLKLVNPANKRKHTIIVVGTGLAGGSAAATLGERVGTGGVEDQPLDAVRVIGGGPGGHPPAQ